MFNNLEEYESYVELCMRLCYPLDVLGILHRDKKRVESSYTHSCISSAVRMYIYESFEYGKINNLGLLYYGHKIFEEERFDTVDNERLYLFQQSYLPRSLFKFPIESLILSTRQYEKLDLVYVEPSDNCVERLEELRTDKCKALFYKVKQDILDTLFEVI